MCEAIVQPMTRLAKCAAQSTSTCNPLNEECVATSRKTTSHMHAMQMKHLPSVHSHLAKIHATHHAQCVASIKQTTYNTSSKQHTTHPMQSKNSWNTTDNIHNQSEMFVEESNVIIKIFQNDCKQSGTN